MNFIGRRYYRLNKFLLLCLGLWPYQTSVWKKIQIIFFQTLFISFLVCQCNTFLINQYSIDHIVRISLFIVINCIYIIKYNACLLLTDNIKYIFDRVQYDWNMLKAQAELKMIQRYANDAKLYTVCFTILSHLCLLGLLILYCIPYVFDVTIPMNDSQPQIVLIRVEYFIDKEKYFFAILTHIILTQYVGCITITAIATILIAYVLHTCAMFRIASYRIEHMFDENIRQIPKNIREHILYEKLIHAVYIHRRAVDLVDIMTNSFATLYFVLLGFGIASTSLSFVNLFNTIVSLHELELILSIGIVVLHLYYIFLGNYVGQNIIDNSISICEATYNMQWYAAPLWMQKLMLFIMQRSNKKSALTAGGLFDASLEGFATLMSMSISYVMLLQSMETHKKNEDDNSHI
ncbi:uncharacterized protein LOC105426953 [Pogonomyrmex barbatus]|uniref:Odorant receptor n=1 Tax=Pogonomyrmex barbatus TaxID=144034 RepID=A0A6I9WXN5_9HYME|nr:uncharacterized protein LOC105426953 [Pogonomyrmex barbatus]